MTATRIVPGLFRVYGTSESLAGVGAFHVFRVFRASARPCARNS
jgi:hypothetical protein